MGAGGGNTDCERYFWQGGGSNITPFLISHANFISARIPICHIRRTHLGEDSWEASGNGDDGNDDYSYNDDTVFLAYVSHFRFRCVFLAHVS